MGTGTSQRILREIPFLPNFHGPISQDIKTSTCRSRRYGEKGDRLLAIFKQNRLLHNIIIELTDDPVFMPLGRVKEHHWREEGVNSPEEFQKIWEQIHRGAGFVPSYPVYFHKFRRVPIIGAAQTQHKAVPNETLHAKLLRHENHDLTVAQWDVGSLAINCRTCFRGTEGSIVIARVGEDE